MAELTMQAVMSKVKEWAETWFLRKIGKQTLDGDLTITSSARPPISLTGTGAGTYNRTAIYNDTTNGFYVDVARETDASNGTPRPFTVASRGGTIMHKSTGTGFGVKVTPQSLFHASNGTYGFMVNYATGVAGTEVTLLENGTGDVANIGWLRFVCKDNAGSMSGYGSAITPGSEVVVGTSGNTSGLAVGCDANGRIYTVRSFGTATYTVVVELIWF